MLVPLSKLCSKRPVQLRQSLWLQNVSSDLFHKRYIGTALLINSAIPANFVAIPFTGLSTLVPTAVFCSPHLLVRFSFVCYSYLLLFCREYAFFYRCFADGAIALQTSSCPGTRRSKFHWTSYTRSTVAGNQPSPL